MDKQKIPIPFPNPVRIVLSTLGYLLYFGANLLFIAVTPFFLLLSHWPTLVNRCINFTFHFYLHFLTRICLTGLGVYKVVEESGFSRLDNHAPLIFVANHRSRIDGPILLALLKNTAVVIKSSYAKLPVFSSFVKHLNFISIDPHSTESMSSALHRCEQLLRDGHQILIFPEGTRSRSAKLQPFKELAFRLSIETKTAVLPIILHTDFPFMAKIPRSIFPPQRMRFTLRALPPIFPEASERAASLAGRVQKLMAEVIRNLDKNTVWEKL